MKTLFRFIVLSISLSLCINVFSANNISKVTYKWTDEQGVVQYTERPPTNRAYEKITVSTSGSQEVTNVSAEEATANADGTEVPIDDVALANERNCKVAQQNMKVLINIARIKVSDEKGDNRILTPEEKQARINETQKQIDIYCKK